MVSAPRDLVPVAARKAACAVCGRTAGGPDGVRELLRCGRCLVVEYCGAECQRKAWPAHKRECAAPGKAE